MSRLRRWWPAGKGDRMAIVVLGALLVLGVALRALMAYASTPGLIGAPDSSLYFHAARNELFNNGLQPAGYPIFLRLLHVVVGQLSFAIVMQHVLGVATGLLLFATVRRVAPAGWGLIPAAVMLLAGPQLFLEHSAMSEGLFVFLVAAIIYCATRALDDRPIVWGALAGLSAAGAATVRSVGLVFTLILAVWLVAAVPGPVGQRLRVGGVAVFCAWLVLATYVVAARNVVGYVGPSLSRAGGFSLYSRVAEFADCTRFTPPAGARGLCERRPPSQRPGHDFYLGSRSPALRTFRQIGPEEDAALTAFARAAILHQPRDWLGKIGTDLTRFWSSSAHDRGQDDDYDALQRGLLATHGAGPAVFIRGWYGTYRTSTRSGPLGFMRGWEEHTRLEGPLFVLLALFALAGLPLARGRRLAVGALAAAATAVTLLGPLATAFFNARYAVPVYGPLALSGAIGGACLWERGAAWLARRRDVGGLPERVAA